jgi:integrase
VFGLHFRLAAIAAQRASISRTTLVKIEKGDPGVAIGIYATVLFVLGMANRLGDLAAPKNESRGPAARRRKPAAAHSRGAQNETHERQVMDREALVYVDLDGVPHLMGRLWARTGKNKESATFEYDKTWLENPARFSLEPFKVWRVERIKKKRFARGATGLVLDAAILHRVFAFAVESEMIARNPVRMEGRPGENPEHGAEPFTAKDLSRLREHAGDDLLTFLLLRWTGFRGSDAISLTWREVHFDRKEIDRVTQKRRKRVILPIHTELLFGLESEWERRKPDWSDRVLLNPLTCKPLTRPRLYHRMLALGKRASVPDAHPHRFRDTLAVDMLIRGASASDVAKMLGDTIETVEKHYTPFVRELRERVRIILETGTGLENLSKIQANHPQNAAKKPN